MGSQVLLGHPITEAACCMLPCMHERVWLCHPCSAPQMKEHEIEGERLSMHMARHPGLHVQFGRELTPQASVGGTCCRLGRRFQANRHAFLARPVLAALTSMQRTGHPRAYYPSPHAGDWAPMGV
eukprot:159701-Chlamydomonas_euryale.AAC.3